MTRQIVVEIVGDADKFGKATDQAITKSGSLTDKLKGVGKGMTLGVGIAAFGLLENAVGTAIGKLGEAAEAYRADQAGQALLANALQNNIPNWDGNAAGAEKYAAAQGRLGFADDEVRASLGQLVGITHDLTAAQDLNSLAQDIARAKGIDLAAATDIVTKAAQGNGKALKGLGVDIGGAKTAAEMLEAVQKNVKGSAEKWAATNEGKLTVSNVKVGEAMEKVGGIVDKVSQVVLPVLADAFSNIVDALSDVWVAIQPVISTVARQLQPVFQAIGRVAGEVFGAIVSVVKGLQPVFQTVFDVVSKIIGVQIKVWTTAFDIVKAAIRVLQDVFKGLGDFIGRVFSTVGGVVKGAINGVIGIINGVISAINGIQVHIHFGPVNLDWNGLNIPHIPRLHAGGIVPGAPGTDVLTMLQAGERVIAAGSAGGGGAVTIIFNGPVYGEDIDDLTRRIASRLRFAG